MKPRVLILRTAGTNCDAETAHAFELAGGDAVRLHLNRILENPKLLDEYQAIALPGGFSYGDDIAAGKILANQINQHLSDALRHFVTTGRPIIGICNGFQVLVKTSLLPGPLVGRTGQLATLTNNDSHRFIARWITLKPISHKCIWTAGLHSDGEKTPLLQLPVAHGEGKLVAADEPVRRALWDHDQVALTYTRPDGSPADGEYPFNPNGAVDDIAGICDDSGLVFGLMPHPERYVSNWQHPAWTRNHFDAPHKNGVPRSVSLASSLQCLPKGGADAAGAGGGLAIFRNAMEYIRQGVGTMV